MSGDSSVVESTVEGQTQSAPETRSAERGAKHSPGVPGALRSASMKLVYLSLDIGDPQTPSQLRDTLDLSLYTLLERLEAEEFVERTGKVYTVRSRTMESGSTPPRSRCGVGSMFPR